MKRRYGPCRPWHRAGLSGAMQLVLANGGCRDWSFCSSCSNWLQLWLGTMESCTKGMGAGGMSQNLWVYRYMQSVWMWETVCCVSGCEQDMEFWRDCSSILYPYLYHRSGGHCKPWSQFAALSPACPAHHRTGALIPTNKASIYSWIIMGFKEAIISFSYGIKVVCLLLST